MNHVKYWVCPGCSDTVNVGDRDLRSPPNCDIMVTHCIKCDELAQRKSRDDLVAFFDISGYYVQSFEAYSLYVDWCEDRLRRRIIQ